MSFVMQNAKPGILRQHERVLFGSVREDSRKSSEEHDDSRGSIVLAAEPVYQDERHSLPYSSRYEAGQRCSTAPNKRRARRSPGVTGIAIVSVARGRSPVSRRAQIAMALSSGTRLGPYDILSARGAGGMGEVYRARDTRLDRDVAIKVLRAAFVFDSDRVARFRRESKTIAALNHPNIAAIYGVDESDGMTALVLEFVEGPTLADRIAQGPVLLDEALPIAKQIVEALEAAHEHGIVHRDLKPANIKVQSDGEGARLWPGQGTDAYRGCRPRRFGVTDHHRSGGDSGGDHPRQRRVHEPGAGTRQSRRQTYRSGHSERVGRRAVLPPPAPSSETAGLRLLRSSRS